MPPEDVVHVLDRMVSAVRQGGSVLDLQVIRPGPRVEFAGRAICDIDTSAVLVRADAARSAIDALVAAGRLADEAFDDHDVLTHYENGIALIDDWQDHGIPDGALPALRAIRGTVVARERCRLRRLRLP